MKCSLGGKRDLIKYSLIDIATHLLVAVVFSGLLYQLFKEPAYVFWFLLGAVFIDLDHIPEYFLYSKGRFIPKDFFSCASLKSGKAYVLFHGWEINLALFLLGIVLNAPALTFLSFGLSAHLAVDNLRKRNIFCYLLTYRIIKRFKASVIFPEFVA